MNYARLTSPMPDHVLTGASVWSGREMQASPERWLRRLSTEEIADLEFAAAHFLALGQPLSEITMQEFPLTILDRHLFELRDNLLHGVGVEVLRGLDAGKYSSEFLAAIFCGIGSHLGSARSQNSAGDVLGHVRNTGADAADPNVRIYQTSARQTFHTDSADVVGLLCVCPARRGGESLLVSAASIYNRMRSDCPGLLPHLFEPIATDRRGEVPAGANPFMEIPPLNWHKGFLTVFYQRQYIDSAQRFPEALRLTGEHIAALDAFDCLANDPELHFSMQLEPGDLQFVYNHAHLHDRMAFEDWPELQRRRHLLRLWLSIPGDRPLPPCFVQRYGSIRIGDRGGIEAAVGDS